MVGDDNLTAEIADAYWREIAEARFELEQTKIMIEKKFTETVSPLEMLQMSAYLSELLATRKIAFIDRYGSEEINEPGKRINRNRAVKMQIFTDTNAAESWLSAS